MLEIFSSEGFMPHGHCYLWNPGLIALHLLSDVLIALAYTTIPFTLVYFIRKRMDVPFRWLFLWFGLFIVSCGGTHAFEAWNLYHASYWLAGLAKAFTAVASLVTAFLLVRVVPEAIALPSPDALRRANESLRQSEQRYRTLVETAREMIITVDLEGRFTSFNGAFEALTGWSAVQWLGRSFIEVVHPEDTAACWTVFEAALRGQASASVAHRIRTQGGGWLEFETTATPQLQDGRVVAVLGVARNVTARVQAEEALSQSQRRLRALFENALDAIFVIDDEGRYVDANPAATDLVGYSREELLDLTIEDVTPEASRQGLFDTWLAFRKGGTYSGEYALLRKDGGVRDAEFRSVANSLPGLHFAIARDITDRKRMEQERESLLRRLVHLQEEERRAISRELHDEVGQLLTGLKLMIEHSEAAGTATRMEEMKRVVNDLIGRMRDLSTSLRPPMLDELGVLPTLLWHIERFEKQTEIAVEFRHANLDRRFPAKVELTAVRVVQEALTNVARHAGVAEARVEVWASRESLGIRIEDRGRGFDLEAALAGHSTGLSGMRERCRLLRGRLAVESTLGGGARVLAELPIGDSTGSGTER
jgi:two-component system sensor histidine kinase UhpB